MRLPPWLTPLPDAAQQRETDAWAIHQQAIPGLELMERAGRGLAEAVWELAPRGDVAVVCGKGNNGGDGLVAARVLRQRGRQVSVLLLGPPNELQGDAAVNLERLPGPGPEQFSPQRLEGAAVIVDAVLGTGFSGTPREPAHGAIEAVNRRAAHAMVIACDVPTGVDGSTGEVSGAAVKADCTVTFHAGKPGLWIAPGKSHAGEVRVVDIGIPAGEPSAAAVGLIADEVTDAVPRRGRDSTKFAAGNVLVCGGSTGLTGAPCLTAQAAARAGAGYVTVCVPASLNLVFEIRLLEVMSAPVPDRQGAMETSAGEAIRGRAERADALVLGPGMGRTPDTAELIRQLAADIQLPLLLDADGLNAHADRLATLASRPAPTVLTPHAGELGRLLGCDSGEVQAHRLRSARRAADASRAVVVLKGDDTLIAEPAGRVAVNRGGAAALATAGSGDVLSGVIAAYLAKGMDPFHAACAGVSLHTAAGRLAGRQIGAEGVVASDVIEQLPRALAPVSA